MANTINVDADSQIKDVTWIHGEIAEFVKFLRDSVQPAIGTSYGNAVKIPARAQRLIDAKTLFDSKNHSGAVTKAIMEKDKGYDDWTAMHTTDLNSIITKAAAIRDLIEANIAQFPPSYDASHQMVFVTASAGTQTALNNEINDILTHVV